MHEMSKPVFLGKFLNMLFAENFTQSAKCKGDRKLVRWLLFREDQ